MNRREQIVAAVVLCILALCAWPCRGQSPVDDTTPPTSVVAISSQVLHNSALLYREFHTEFIACLFGRVNGDTVLAAVMVLADIRPSQSEEAAIKADTDGAPLPCRPSPLMVGMIHSHPSRVCRPSVQDERTFVASGHAAALIACGPGKLFIRTQHGAALCYFNPEDPVAVCKPPGT